jgi:CDP-glycerol glycerophosphotransferase (TagB/SpsB family)
LTSNRSGEAILITVVASIFRGSFQVLYWLCVLVPARRRILFLSRQSDRVSSDFEAIIKEIGATQPEARVVVLTRKVRSRLDLGYALHLVRQTWHLAHADTVVLDSYSLLTSNLRLRATTRVVQIWHAIGSFKRFGWDSLATAGARRVALARAFRMHAGNDILLTSSSASAPHFASAFKTSLAHVTVCPLPRVDALRDEARIVAQRNAIFTAHPEWREQPILVYAPTLTKDSMSGNPLGVLSEFCEHNGYRLIESVHPVDLPVPPEFSTTELLSVATLFVTDRSSLVLETGWMGIPSFLLCSSDELDALVESSYMPRSELEPLVVSDARGLETKLLDASATKSAQNIAAKYITPPATGSCASSIVALLLQ